MPNATDVTIGCLLLFFLLDGWRKGFFKSAVGPMTFIFCSIMGIIYYDLTDNFLKAISLTLIATTALTMIFLFMFALGQRALDPTYRNYSSWLSRLLGSGVNVLWQGGVALVIIALIALAPLQIYGLTQVQNNIQQSLCYSYITTNVLSKIPALQKIVTAFSIFQNPDEMQQLSTTEEFREFFANKKVKSLLQDDAFMENVKKQNFSKIATNPKVLEIFDDTALMDNFVRLAKKVYALDLPEGSIPEPQP